MNCRALFRRCWSTVCELAESKPSFSVQSIPEQSIGDRVDKFIAGKLGVPFSHAQKMLRVGKIRLHDGIRGHKLDGSYRLRSGDRLAIPVGASIAVPLSSSSSSLSATKKLIYMSDAEAAEFQRRVLFRNEHVLVLNKPAGLATQGGTNTIRHIDGMLQALQFDSTEIPRLVHRLDKDVAGCLVLARSREAAVSLGSMFSGRESNRLRKVYWAALASRPVPSEGRIKMPLSKDAIRVMDELKVVPTENPGLKVTAITEYMQVEHAGKSAAFVELYPETGRKHQIRVHCAEALRCAIIGDTKYGQGVPAHLAEVLGSVETVGLQLFARSITLPYADGEGQFEKLDGGRIRVTAPLPDHMVPVWKFFGWNKHHKSAN